MEQKENAQLCQQLKSLDHSIFFLILIIFSLCLSLYALHIQRRQALCPELEGQDAFPFRLCGSALVTGSLGFFLCLAVANWRQTAQGQNCAARRSAGVNLWAALLVFLAALLRLGDLLENRPAEIGSDST